MKYFALPAAALALLLLTQCKKNNPDPVSQLPPETQTGANTIGCLVNGQAWTPRGNNGFSNYRVDFDPTYQSGTLIIHTYRYADNWQDFQSMHFGGNHIAALGKYGLGTQYYFASFSDTAVPGTCGDFTSGITYCKGTMTVTRLDRVAGIVSGTFEFTLGKAGCDTVRVTNGRFDKKM